MCSSDLKAAMQHLAEILYMELRPAGIGVSVVNPGFVATPLTAQNRFHMPALIQPDEAARAMLKGWARGEFEIHFPKRFSRFLFADYVYLTRWAPSTRSTVESLRLFAQTSYERGLITLPAVCCSVGALPWA